MSLLIQETVSRIVEVAHGPGAKEQRIKRARTLTATFRDLSRERQRNGVVDTQLRDKVSAEVERLREALARRRQSLVREHDDRADEVFDALSHRLFD
jgi:hypothetical protein